MFDFCMEMLSDEVQPSVRLYIEWMTSLLLLRHAQLQRHLWENLLVGSSKKAACLCSLLSLVMHIAKLISNPVQKVSVKLQGLVQHATPVAFQQNWITS